MDFATVPAAPPTRKNHRATSCPAPISAKVPYLVGSRLTCSAFWCVSIPSSSGTGGGTIEGGACCGTVEPAAGRGEASAPGVSPRLFISSAIVEDALPGGGGASEVVTVSTGFITQLKRNRPGVFYR